MAMRISLLIAVCASLILAQGITDVPETRIDMEQTAGLQVSVNDRSFNSMAARNKILALSLNYPMTARSNVIASVGFNKQSIITSGSNSKILDGKLGWFGKAEINYRIYLIYCTGAIHIYKMKNSIIEYENQVQEYQYDNNYTFLEYPLSAGIILPIYLAKLRVGIRKTYLYGTNEKGIQVTYGGGTSDLGIKKHSFIDQLPFALTTGIAYKITPKYSLEIEADLYSATKYQFTLTVWSKIAQSTTL